MRTPAHHVREAGVRSIRAAHSGVQAATIDVGAQRLLEVRLPGHGALQRQHLLAGAVDLIAPVRTQATRFGGSHAQRDLIDQRRMAKPVTPLMRHCIRQPNIAETAR